MTTARRRVVIMGGVGAATAFALLLAEFGFAASIAATLNDEDLDVVGQAVDEGDGAGGVGEDGVPVFEGQVGGDEQGAVLVTAADELEEEVGGPCVIGEISHLVAHQERGPGVVPEASFERTGSFLTVEIEQEVGGSRE